MLPAIPGKAAAAASKGGKSTAAEAKPAASAPAPAEKSASVVQPPPGTQTVLLPSGNGQSAFSCFRDRKQSRFGQFIAMLIPPASLVQPLAPVLMMPAIGVGALNAVRSIVGMVASHPAGDQAGDQATVFQQPPRDIAATRECPLAGDKRALRLRTGIYLLAPKRVAAQLRNPADYKILDGWLVPKNAQPQEALDASRETLPNMTYLTMEVKVERATATCSAAAKKA